MLFNVPQAIDFKVYATRRKNLIDLIKKRYPNNVGTIVLFAGFEAERIVFRQESSFYYLTGIQEPGVVLVLELDGAATLYVPHCVEARAQWVQSAIPLTEHNAGKFGLQSIKPLGAVCPSYQFHPFFPAQEYSHFLTFLEQLVTQKGSLFTCSPATPHGYVEQRIVLQRLYSFIPGLSEQVIDISSCIAQLRRTKDMHEMELIYKAVEITVTAQEAAAGAIDDDMTEAEVQASLEYIMTAGGARLAFPSIVGSGKQSTILHYNFNNGTMKNGDLVVVDIGAEFGNYAADLTRTYPVSGAFTKRQREIYTMVLETQEYIAGLAKPGMWLSHKEHADKSLNHLSHQFLAKKGYDKYFPHGIGHFLGLDVHDVGDHSVPLQEGDVITIEPGIYIPQENIGIRVEDDYWIVKDGVVCLSEGLPKDPDDIEAFVQQSLDDEDDLDIDEDDEAFIDDEDYESDSRGVEH